MVNLVLWSSLVWTAMAWFVGSLTRKEAEIGGGFIPRGMTWQVRMKVYKMFNAIWGHSSGM